MFRRLRRALLVLVLLLAGAGIGATLLLGGIIRSAVEREGTKALGTAVSLDGARVNLLAGRINLGRLRVSNPGGFSRDPLLDLEGGRVEADLSTLFADEVRIPDVILDRPTFRIEALGIRTNLEAIAVALGAGVSGRGETTGRRFRVERILIREPRLLLVLPGGATREIRRPDIEIRPPGAGPGRAAELPRILAAVLGRVSGEAGAAAGDPGERLRGAFETLGQTLEDLGREGGDSGKGIEEIRRRIEGVLKER